jgi:hypothetical protein
MTSKSHDGSHAHQRRDQPESLLEWLYARGEQTLAQVVEDLARNKALTDTVARTIKRASKAKHQLDQNVQTVLGLLNLPSMADYKRLLTKIETVQGSLINVNMKLDRILAALAEKPERKRPAHRGDDE